MPAVLLRSATLDGAVTHVLVDDGVIAAIGPDPAPPAKAEVVDLDGRVLLPGLWDAHVHFDQWTLARRRLDLGPARSAAEATELVATRLRTDPPEPAAFGPFAVVTLANGVSLDYMQAAEVVPQHYAFLVGDDEFAAVVERLGERGVPTWADPWHATPGENHNDGGRGLYFDSPEGHNLEIITRPYGSGG